MNARVPPTVVRLMAARAARSLGQGALVAGFALYLHALGWSAPAIGATLSAALVAGAVLTLSVGPMSDRRGRRSFLLAYELLQAAAALLALLTASPPALVLAAIVGGFGRGANGGAGPFSPLEQAWLAQALPAGLRGPVFSANAGIGLRRMALGPLLAGGGRLLDRALGAPLPLPPPRPCPRPGSGRPPGQTSSPSRPRVPPASSSRCACAASARSSQDAAGAARRSATVQEGGGSTTQAAGGTGLPKPAKRASERTLWAISPTSPSELSAAWPGISARWKRSLSMRRSVAGTRATQCRACALSPAARESGAAPKAEEGSEG